MVLPLVKLGTLALKTACKPIANRLKKEASLHPRFVNTSSTLPRFCDQANHRLTTQIQRRIYGHRTDVEIRPLNEEKAVQAAADLIGEVFVFAVAGAAVIFEVQRSAKSDARKEEARAHEMQLLRQKDEDLAREVEALKQRFEELEQLAKEQAKSGSYHLPSPKHRNTINPTDPIEIYFMTSCGGCSLSFMQ
ncbi:Optic atrophy 3 protein-like protein [Bienertia sinuspersici]